MGNHLSGNGNYLHSHGNLFPKVLCCDELLLVLYLSDANAYCAEFADYRNVIYSAPRHRVRVCAYRALGKPRHFRFLFIAILSTCHRFGLFVTIMVSKEDIQQLVIGMGGNGNSSHGNPMGMGISQKWEWGLEGMGIE